MTRTTVFLSLVLLSACAAPPERLSGVYPVKRLAEVEEIDGQIAKESEGGDKYIVLKLKNPDYNVCAAIACEINYTLFPYTDEKSGNTRYLEVARTIDSGTIHVFIPTKEEWERLVQTMYPGYEQEPVLFVDRVLMTDVVYHEP
ncbi:MAG: hypothetical protein ACYTAF_00350 [Planctomycetota bacterium]|jgi:hypothetical protein